MISEHSPKLAARALPFVLPLMSHRAQQRITCRAAKRQHQAVYATQRLHALELGRTNGTFLLFMRTGPLVPSFVTYCSSIPQSSSRALNDSWRTKITKCPRLRSSSVHTRARLIESSERRSQVTNIEAKLRSLGAKSAARQARGLLDTQGFDIPETWLPLLRILGDHGITNKTLSKIVSKLGVVKFLSISPASVSNIFHLFDSTLRLPTYQQRRILLTKPEILDLDVNLISDTLQALYGQGMRYKDVRRIVLIHPHVLLLHPTSISRLAKFFYSSPLSLPDYRVRSILRRSPWLFTVDIDTYMAPCIDWLLEHVVQHHEKSDLAKLILSEPAILRTKRASLHSVLRLLEHEAFLGEKDRLSVVNSHPRILVCSPEAQLRPVLLFLQKTLRVKHYELRRIVRAFPHILTLDVDQQIIPVVDFFTAKGASDVSRLVTHFPPILGYDLLNKTIPTMEYLIHEVGLSLDTILMFPAIFSYDMSTRIIPRTQFVLKMGCSVREFGLSRIVSPSDSEFCHLFRVQYGSYTSFCEASLALSDGGKVQESVTVIEEV